MKLKVNLILTSLILTLMFYGCGKETQSSTQGGGLFKIRYTTQVIGPKDLIVYNAENYAVQSVVDVGERHREHELVGRKTT